MKILFLTPRIPYPPNDGGAQAMWQLIHAMQQLGHAVTVASLNPAKHYIHPAEWPAPIPLFTVGVTTTPTFWGAVAAALFQHTPYPVLRYLHIGFAELLVQLLATENYDVIQLETLFMTPYLNVIRRYSRARIVLRAHNVEHEIWQRLAHHERQLPRKLYYGYLAGAMKKYEAEVLKHIDGLLAITHTDVETFRKLGNTGCYAVVSPWVTLAYQVTEANAGHTVAYLGALNWQPNLQGLRWFIQEVWPKVLAQMPHTELHIAGKAPLPEIQQWASASVTIDGEVPDAAAYLEKFSVIIIPVQVGSGIRLKLLEAMALGKAIVTTTIGAQGTAVQSGREVFIADDAKTFAASMLELLQNSMRRRAMGAYARAHVQALHNEADALAAVRRFYDELLANTKQ